MRHPLAATAATILIILLQGIAPALHAQETSSKEGRTWFRRTIDFFFFDIDTNFIEADAYRMNVSLKSDIRYDNYTLRGGRGDDKALTISQRPSYSIGAYIGWEVLTVGWSVNIHETFLNRGSKTRNTDLSFSLVGTFLGCDLYYRNYKDGFRVVKSTGFGEEPNSWDKRDIDGVETKIAGINAWYIFNRRRLAYPAVYAHSSKQKRSCGSLMVGASYTLHDFHLDDGALPQDYEDFIEAHSELQEISYHNISLGVGYTYNFAFLKNFTANLTLLPSAAYHISRLKQTDEGTPIYKNLNFDLLAKGGLTYNNGRFFAGCTAQFRTYFNRKGHSSIVNNTGTMSIFAGFNFWRKK